MITLTTRRLNSWTGATATQSQDIDLLFPWGRLALHFLLLFVLVKLEFFLLATILQSPSFSLPEEGLDSGISMLDAMRATIIFLFWAVRLLICLFWVTTADSRRLAGLGDCCPHLFLAARISSPLALAFFQSYQSHFFCLGENILYMLPKYLAG